MSGKKMEGNEQERRKRARVARQQGRSPSQQAGTTGASKQQHHLAVHDDHIEKVDTIRAGKAQAPADDVSRPQARPRSRRWHYEHEHDVHEHPPGTEDSDRDRRSPDPDLPAHRRPTIAL